MALNVILRRRLKIRLKLSFKLCVEIDGLGKVNKYLGGGSGLERVRRVRQGEFESLGAMVGKDELLNRKHRISWGSTTYAVIRQALSCDDTVHSSVVHRRMF